MGDEAVAETKWKWRRVFTRGWNRQRRSCRYVKAIIVTSGRYIPRIDESLWLGTPTDHIEMPWARL